MARLALGVDPGLTGAVAGVDLDSGNRLMFAEDTPVAAGSIAVPLLRVLTDRLLSEGHEIVRVAIERVNSMPGQGVASTFKFGRSFGTVEGYFGAFWPVTLVTPTTWKGQFTLNGKEKDAARALAISRWPMEAGLLARKKDIGRADAAMIALWCAEVGIVPALAAT